MNETQETLPAPEMVRGRDNGTENIEMYEVRHGPMPEQRVMTSEVMALKHQRYKWCCWMHRCNHAIPFRGDELDAVPFLIVRHFINDHGLLPDAVAPLEPVLADEVAIYCKTVDMKTPVAEQTGVSTKMDSPR